jgi:uncharacterized membrane protein YhaH (DUF805 family)
VRDVKNDSLASSNVLTVSAVLSLAIVACDRFGQMLYYPPRLKQNKTKRENQRRIEMDREPGGQRLSARESYLMTLRNSFDFRGRSSRKEVWTFLLANAPINLLLQVCSPESIGATPAVVWAIAIAIPTLAVTVRRLHDIGCTGWWLAPVIISQIIPYGGGLLVIALLGALLRKGVDGENKYGPSPAA